MSIDIFSSSRFLVDLLVRLGTLSFTLDQILLRFWTIWFKQLKKSCVCNMCPSLPSFIMQTVMICLYVFQAVPCIVYMLAAFVNVSEFPAWFCSDFVTFRALRLISSFHIILTSFFQWLSHNQIPMLVQAHQNKIYWLSFSIFPPIDMMFV